MKTALEYAAANAARFLQEFTDFVRIPSVSTQPEHKADVRRAAEWIRSTMLRIGLTGVEVIDVPGGRHPLVYGEWMGAGADAPVILVYSHYDVQPAALEDGWESDPFEPVVRDGILYARGATDSKVHVVAYMKALECMLATGENPPSNIKFIFEGEEESGSETITAFVKTQGERLKADAGVIADSGMISVGKPSLTYALRGIATLEVRITGPRQDLHSGHFGGNTHNPAQAAAEIVAKLHDANGRVAVPGFYDDVLSVDDVERATLSEISPWIESEWQQIAGAPQPWGESEYTLYERIALRPTLEINGISSGYTGDGFKTVLPAKAIIKISCRLVANQDPDRIAQLVREYILSIAPPTVTVDAVVIEPGAPAMVIDRYSKAMLAAGVAYEKTWGEKVLFERVGGSVPIAYDLQKIVGELAIVGLTYRGGKAHGPNENIPVVLYHKGIETAIHFYREYKP